MAFNLPLGLDMPKTASRVSREPAWSTYRLSPGNVREEYTHAFRLFSCPVGCVGQGFDRALDESDTSLREACALSSHMIVDAVEWRVSGGTETDRRAVVESGWWKWEFGGGTIFQGSPLATFDAAGIYDDSLPEDERASIMEALRTRDESLNGRLSYWHREGSSPVQIPAHHTFTLVLYLRGFALSRETFVRFTLRGTSMHTIPIS